MKLSVCRNTDKALPASHMIEIMFNLPPDFPLGGIFSGDRQVFPENVFGGASRRSEL
jgi:hypothetical protein